MKNEFQKHKKNDGIKWIATLTAFVMLAVGVTAAITKGFKDFNPYGWFNKEKEISAIAVDEKGNAMENDKVYSMPSQLNFSGQALLAAAENGVSVNINATVLPVTAENKKVDWTVEWSDTTKTEPVSQYVTVTPTTDGSTTARVTCLKSFTGEILIIVTTREGGFNAMCTVSFIGKPSALAIKGNGVTSSNNSNIGEFYSLGVGKTFNFNVTPSNVFGKVGATCAYTYSVSAVGNIVVQNQTYNGTTGARTWTGTERSIAISSIEKANPQNDKFYNCSISSNVLSISVICTLDSYVLSSQRVSQNVAYVDKFKSYENDNWYFVVTVTETNSGISQSIKIRPIQTVSSVSIQDNVLSF